MCYYYTHFTDGVHWGKKILLAHQFTNPLNTVTVPNLFTSPQTSHGTSSLHPLSWELGFLVLWTHCWKLLLPFSSHITPISSTIFSFTSISNIEVALLSAKANPSVCMGSHSILSSLAYFSSYTSDQWHFLVWWLLPSCLQKPLSPIILKKTSSFDPCFLASYHPITSNHNSIYVGYIAHHVPGTLLSALYIFHSILTRTLEGRCVYYPYFADDEIGARG